MRILLAAVFSAAAPLCAATVVDYGWLPVTDAERQMKAPVVEKNAGVEALFWRVHVLDEIQGGDVQRVLHHYVRLKVFNQDGKDKVATIDIRYSDKTYVVSVSGRTIEPDGSIVELGKGAVHERVLLRAGGLKQKAVSFAMPGVEVGSIIEYRWKEIRTDQAILYLPLQLQREYPVQRVTYFVKPLPSRYTNYRMSILPFNCPAPAFKMDNDGFDSASVENIPAFHEEPMMPGEAGVRQWVLIFYHDDSDKREPAKYWAGIGKKSYGELKQSLKLNGDLKQAAAEATSGAKTDEEKVDRLITYLHANVRELWDRRVSDAERAEIIKKMPRDRERSSSEIFKSGIGTAAELNTLFAALAEAAGLDARPALISNRNDLMFNERLTERYFLRNIDMAVMINGKWKLYDVSSAVLRPGMLAWNEEGARALIADPKDPVFIAAPLSPPDASMTYRTGRFALSADGTLDGDVDLQYTGHSAFNQRLLLTGESADRSAEVAKEEAAAVWPQAEITNVRVENADKTDRALAVRYHIKVPEYAARTGKRMFVQPLFFERGATPLFTAADRKYDVHFHYAWHEIDQINIMLPDGYELEKAENPGGMNFGAPGSYVLNMAVSKGRELVCRRELTFGQGEQLFYSRDMYKQLKLVFDEIDRRDKHTLALKQSAAPVGVTQ